MEKIGYNKKKNIKKLFLINLNQILKKKKNIYQKNLETMLQENLQKNFLKHFNLRKWKQYYWRFCRSYRFK